MNEQDKVSDMGACGSDTEIFKIINQNAASYSDRQQERAQKLREEAKRRARLNAIKKMCEIGYLWIVFVAATVIFSYLEWLPISIALCLLTSCSMLAGIIIGKLWRW